jgi:hypothetical protein
LSFAPASAVLIAGVITWVAMLGTAGAQEQLPMTNIVAGLQLRSEPVTVKLSPQPGLTPALQAAQQGHSPITLAVEGIAGTLTQPVRINVFVNKPDANSRTTVEDPHFLGYISISPRPGGVKGAGRAFDLSAMAALDPAAPIEVTLVPVAGINGTPRDAALQVGRIYIGREK